MSDDAAAADQRAVQFGMVSLVSRVTETCGTGAQLEPLNSLPSTAHEVPATSSLRSDEISMAWSAVAVEVLSRLSMRRTIDWLIKRRCAVFLAVIADSELSIDREMDRVSVLAVVEISRLVEAGSSAVCAKVAISSEIEEPVSEISDK